MSLEEYLRKGLAAAAVVGAHVAVLYVLAVMSPAITSAVTGAPLTVHFISRPESRPAWQPPPVRVVTPAVLAHMPRMPQVEAPVAPPPASRAISVASQPPQRAARQDRSIPRQVSVVEYVREPAPRYPPLSRRLHEQGLVVLRVVIDERGKACSIEIERSSGHERLDLAAREAVSRAEFRPYLEDGTPRRAQVLIPIEFSLNRGTA